MKNTMKNWLKLNYGKSAVETHYWNIKPKVFAEQYIENISSDSRTIKDYKFFVFNRKVRYIYVTKDYHVKDVRPCFNYYDENFNFIEDMARPYPHSNDPSRIDEKPKFFEQMKDVAEKLAKYFNLVRIDFYLTNDRFYLGEMTFTPSAGSFYFTKPEYNVKLGNMI